MQVPPLRPVGAQYYSILEDLSQLRRFQLKKLVILNNSSEIYSQTFFWSTSEK
jgi:hypothetical protein